MLLKASQKSQYRKLLQRQVNSPSKLGGSVNIPARAITNHYVYEEPDITLEKRMHILDTKARVHKHIGFFYLNREHRYNTLTSNYIKNIKRGLETLNQDDHVKLIYMTGGKREQFSNGTDFRSILFNKNQEKYDGITQYLTDLYSLQISTAKINKPIMAVAPGHSFNSGASFLQATGIPTTTLDSKIAFNDVSYGFVPHGGSTYYLSRMPGELGTFLAVTGLPMTGIDAKVLGLSDMVIHQSKPYELMLIDYFKYLDFPLPNGWWIGDCGRQDPWNEMLKAKQEDENNEYMADLYQASRKRHENLLTEEFFEPKDKKPTIGNAEMMYKRMIRQHNRLHNIGEGAEEEYLGYANTPFQNYFQYVSHYVRHMVGEQDHPLDGQTVMSHMQEINRCFFSNTLEEIIENLKKENSAFAKKCLEQMSLNSTLSMKLALRMVRDARSLDYKGCLKNEINVALNKIQDAEFDMGISQVLMKPGKHGTKPNFRKDVPNDEVERFLQKNKFTEAVELDVVEKAMLPARDYYETFPDQVRLWINESSTPQQEVREHFEFELKNSLRSLGIDLRDRALTIESARDALYQQEMWNRNMSHYQQRLEQLLLDDKLRNRYFEETKKEVQILKEDKELFYKKVNEKIQHIFEQAYLEKLDLVFQKSKEVHDLEKRRMFIKFKKFLFQSRILTFANKEFDKITKQLQNLPFKEIHLTEKWDQSYLHQEHPELQRSILYHISKAVSKRTITPLELAKQYISDPSVAKQLTFLTFDKQELLNIRRDILQNPEKYEKILTEHDNGTFKLETSKFDVKAKKDEEYNYWYRVLNDGRNPWDNVKDYQTYLVYKEFVEGVEKKALGTLRMVVQRLLNDFEHEEGVNEIKEFTMKEKETKRKSIERLMNMLYQAEPVKEPKKIKAKKEAQLIEGQRSVNEIKRVVNNLLLLDPQIKQVIPQAESTNPLIANFRQEIMDDLYNLLELVLLSNDQVYPLPKEVLEERLTALMNPNNKEVGNLAQLRMIDQYLNDHNAEQTIKHAIQLIKPYFFLHIMQKLDTQTQMIYDGFKLHKLGPEMLFLYMIQIHHPEIFRSDAFKRIHTYHSEADRQAYLDQLFPEETHSYKLKQYLSKLTTFVNKNDSISKQEQDLEEQVKNESKIRREYVNSKIEIGKRQQEEIQQMRDLEAKQPLIEDDPQKEMDTDPQFNIYHLRNTAEVEQLSYHMDNISNMHEFFHQRGPDLARMMNNKEIVNMIWALFTQHGYDVRRMFRHFYEAEDFVERDFEQELRNIFGGNKNITFESVAEYAGLIRDLYEQSNASKQTKEQVANFHKVFDFIFNHTENLDEITQTSLFEKLTQEKSYYGIGTRNEKIHQEIRDYTLLQKQLLEQENLRENVRRLVKSAPEEIRLQVEGLLDSNSKYLDLTQTEKLLNQIRTAKKEDLHKIVNQPLDFINRELLAKDLQDGKLISNILRNYHHIPLDVVSLSQTRATIKDAPTDQVFTPELKSQMSLVLDFINDQLKTVSHQRRKEMKLGEFMKRHQLISKANGTFTQFADEILKNKIQQTLGQMVDLHEADVIDWEFANTPTNPLIHEKKDKKIRKAMQEGKSLDDQAEIDERYERESKDGFDFEIRVGQYIDDETGILMQQEEHDLSMEEILRDAKKMTELKPEFHHLKNQFENEILTLYTQEEFDPQYLEETVQRYTELRFKDLMLSDSFRQKVQSNNGHIYLKMLKEEISDELQLSRKAEAEDLLFDKINIDPRLFVDAESRYNLSNLINEEAVGYDNIVERINDPSRNRELAHETLFDKLLSEYFTQKRSSTGNINNLIDEMGKQFNNSSYEVGHESYSKDKYIRNLADFPFEGEAPLFFRKLQQDIKKQDTPTIEPQDFNDLMELDISTSQALQNGKNGLSINLRNDMPDEVMKIPDHYQKFDVRKPAKEYVDDKLTEILKEVFDMRRKLEKTFNRKELLAYDKILIKHLTYENLFPKLQKEIDVDQNTIVQLQQALEMRKESENENDRLQFSKAQHNQAEENKTMKNEDAMYKFLAYSAMLEKTRREQFSKSKKGDDFAMEKDSFEEYYKGELLKDSKLKPRPINEQDYLEGKRVDQNLISEGFQTTEEREITYFREFEMYKENKKETIERNQLFFVLEQLNDQARKQQDPLNKAQEAIIDYFNNPENIYFFNRNKIQFDQ